MDIKRSDVFISVTNATHVAVEMHVRPQKQDDLFK